MILLDLRRNIARIALGLMTLVLAPGRSAALATAYPISVASVLPYPPAPLVTVPIFPHTPRLLPTRAAD